ncbi:MAG: DUF2007 domain-containing protein [Planctomyces sp.]|nr:DUF2007 domain-containing protein [Planctomyces sp.]
MLDERLEVIYTAGSVQEAQFLQDLLEDQGIAARVTGENLGTGAGALPIGWATSPQLLVLEVDAERARAIVLEWEESRRERPDLPDETLADEGPDDARLDD